jgi:hypothetical protein
MAENSKKLSTLAAQKRKEIIMIRSGFSAYEH